MNIFILVEASYDKGKTVISNAKNIFSFFYDSMLSAFDVFCMNRSFQLASIKYYLYRTNLHVITVLFANNFTRYEFDTLSNCHITFWGYTNSCVCFFFLSSFARIIFKTFFSTNKVYLNRNVQLYIYQKLYV